MLVIRNIVHQVFGNILLNNFLANSIRNCINANSFSTIAISIYRNIANVRDPSIISSLDTINHGSVNSIICLQLLKGAKSHITTQSLDNVNFAHSIIQGIIQIIVICKGYKINVSIFIKVSLDKITNISRDTSSGHLLTLTILATIARIVGATSQHTDGHNAGQSRATSQHTDGHNAGQSQSQNLIQFHLEISSLLLFVTRTKTFGEQVTIPVPCA